MLITPEPVSIKWKGSPMGQVLTLHYLIGVNQCIPLQFPQAWNICDFYISIGTQTLLA